MIEQLGEGDFSYRPDPGWLAETDVVFGDVVGIVIDRESRVIVFHRGDDPVVILDRSGSILHRWGSDLFVRPHGLTLTEAGTLYCTDEGAHCVRHCTIEGELLMTIGTPGSPSELQSGEPFNRCTDLAVSNDGDLLITDGYGNARVHKFSADGRHLFSWGKPGIGPGEFNVPHSIGCDQAGLVYVADRESHRIQIFDSDGTYQDELNWVHRPSALLVTAGTPTEIYVGEIGTYLSANRGWPNLGPRISVLRPDGTVLARIAAEPAVGAEPGQFISPHAIAFDSDGDMYVGQVSYTGWPSLFPDVPQPARLQSLQRLVRVVPKAAETPTVIEGEDKT